MNQELKNFDILIVELEGSYKNGDYNAFKTLLNIYTTMYENYSNVYFQELHKDGVGDLLTHHNKILLEFEKDLSSNDFPKLVSNGNYKALHTVQYLIDTLKELNHYMKKKVERYKTSKEITELLCKPIKFPSQFTAKDLLNKSVEGGFLITQVKEDLRGLGKTESLINKANELGVTLLVGRHSIKKLVDEKAHELGHKIDCKYAQNANSLRGYKFKNNKFLVDDSVPNALIRELISYGFEFVGGFNSLSDSLSTLKQPTLLELLHTKLNKLLNERDVINTTYMDEAPTLNQWSELNRKIEVVKWLIEEESVVKSEQTSIFFNNKENNNPNSTFF